MLSFMTPISLLMLYDSPEFEGGIVHMVIIVLHKQIFQERVA